MTFYVSNDAQKVISELARHDITFNRAEDFYGLEFSLGSYFPNHIVTVVKKIVRPSNYEKIIENGWSYFIEPVNSILGPRDSAKRPEVYGFGDLSIERYSAITRSFLVANFNSKEASILFDELSKYDDATIKEGIVASKNANKRTIYYLNGVISRIASDRRGKLAEITDATERAGQCGWSVDQGFEKIDVSERAELLLDWEEKQRIASLRAIFNKNEAY